MGKKAFVAKIKDPSPTPGTHIIKEQVIFHMCAFPQVNKLTTTKRLDQPVTQFILYILQR